MITWTTEMEKVADGGRTTVLILSRTPEWIGGVVSYVEALKTHLGPQVTVDSFVVGRRKHGIARFLGPLLPIFDVARLMRTVRNKHYDVVHVNPSLNSAIVRDSLFVLALRAIHPHGILVFIHGWNQSWASFIDRSRIARILFKWIYGNVDQLIVLASTFQNQLVKWGIEPARIARMTTLFDSTALPRQSPEFDRPPEQLLFIGRFVPEKGLMEAIEAFGRLAPAHPNLRLVLAGDGPARPEVQSQVRSHGLEHRIALPGFVTGDAKTALLRESDVLVFPTYYSEGCPVTLLEAMAAGLAVVVTSVGGIPDVFRDRVNGVLLPCPDEHEVAKAITWLISDIPRLTAIRQHNFHEAWSKYEGSVVARQMELIYCRIARKGSQ